MSPPRLMLLPVATQVAICGTLTCLLTSGITSKPAIDDHFKTGQRTITLDELVLPYRLAVWQVQFDPVRSLIVSPEMPAVIPARRSAGPYSSPPLPASGGEL